MEPIIPQLPPEQPTIDLNPYTTPQTIDIGSGVTSLPPTPQAATQKAVKASYGMSGVDEKTYDDYYQGFLTGQEGPLREDAAAKVNTKAIQGNRESLIDQISKGQFTPDSEVLKWKPTSPANVFEDQFAKRYMDTIYRAYGSQDTPRPFTWLDDAVQTIPKPVENVFNGGTGVIGKTQYALTKLQEMEALYKDQSWFGSALDYVSGMFPGYNSLFLRGNVGPGFFQGGLLGEHLEKEASALFALPWDQYTKRFDEILDQIKANPRLAAHFAASMANPSNRVLDNVFEVVDVFGAQGYAALLKAGSIKGMQLLNNSIRASRSMAKSVPLTISQPIEVAAAQGAGDLRSAAINRQTASVVEEVLGGQGRASVDMSLNEAGVWESIATKKIREDLASVYKEGADSLRVDPGDFRELSTRLATEREVGGNSLITAIENQMKINRTPFPIAVESVQRQLIDAMIASGKYKGRDNQLIDVKGPHYDSLTNTYNYEGRLGTTTGEYFKDADVALHNALINRVDVAPRLLELQKLITKAEVSTRGYEPSFYIPAERATELTNKIGAINQRINSFELNAKDPRFNADEQKVWGQRVNAFKRERSKLQAELDAKPVYKAEYAVKKAALEKDIEKWRAESHDLSLTPFPDGWSLGQQGQGFYLRRMIPNNELDSIKKLISPKSTNKNRRKDLKEGVSTAIPPSWSHDLINGTVGWWRTPEDVLSVAENAQRKIADFGPSVLTNLVKEEGKALLKVPYHYRGDFDRFIHAMNKQINLETGYAGYLPSIGEMQDWYLSNITHNVKIGEEGINLNGMPRMPIEAEVEAYAAYAKLNDFLRTMDNIRAYTDKHRLGTQTHSFTVKGMNGELVKSPKVEGYLIDQLPSDDEKVFVQVGGRIDKIPVIPSNKFTPDLREWVNKMAEDGRAKIIKIVDPTSRPLRDFATAGNQRIGYLVSQTVTAEPLAIRQTALATHPTPKFGWALKQARIATEKFKNDVIHFYEGEANLAPIADATQGRILAHHFSEVSRMLGEEHVTQDGTTMQLAKEYNNRHLGIDWDQHLSWYRPYKGPNGEPRPAELTPGEPVRLVRDGQNLFDTDRELAKRFEYQTSTGNIATTLRQGSNRIHPQDEPPRELFTFTMRKGTDANPMWDYEPISDEHMIDPITMLDRSLKRAIHDSYMSDMKIMSATHWLRLAEEHLNLKEGSVWDAPMYYFYNLGPLHSAWGREFKDSLAWSNLMSMRKKALDFIGEPSSLETLLHRISVNVAEKIEGKTGVDIVPTWKLPLVKSPVKFLGSIANHVYLGTYSVKQIWNQSAQFVVIHAVSPLHAPSATFATYLHTLSKYNRNPGMLEALDLRASRMTVPGFALFKPGQWLEATKGMENVGLHHVGNEYSFQSMADDGFLFPRTALAKTNTFLDWGKTPLRMAAGATRRAAWYTAYLEHVGENPGPVTRLGWEQILTRAHTLDGNMSKASNSMPQQGIGSIPTTFFSYEIRATEAMYSKRYTPVEKTRLLLYTAFLFGIVGTPAGIPVAHFANKWLVEAGMETGKNTAMDTFINGFPALITAIATGGGDPKKGNWYDYSKLGTKGLSSLLDSMDSDKGFLDIFGGARYSMLADTWKGSSGFRKWAGQFMDGSYQFTLKPDHVIDLAKSVAEVKDTWKTTIAFNTGNWLSVNGVNLGPVSKANAFFMGLTGFSLRQHQEAYIRAGLSKTEEDLWKYTEKEFSKEYRRGLQALDTGDKAQARQFFDNAWAYTVIAKYPPERKARILGMAMDDSKDLQTKTLEKWTFQDVPEGAYNERLKSFSEMVRIRQERGDIK